MNVILRWLFDLLLRLLRTVDLPLLGALLRADGDRPGGAVQRRQRKPAPGVSRRARASASAWARCGLLSRVPPTRLRHWTPLVYALSLLPLLLVLLVGEGKHGNHWINLGVFYFQPSELLKLSLPMMLAWYLHREPLPPRVQTVLVAGALIAGAGRADPAAAGFRHRHAGRGQRRVRAVPRRAVVVVVRGRARRRRRRSRRWRGSGSCGRTRRTASSPSSTPNPIRSAPAGTSSSRRSRSAPAG